MTTRSLIDSSPHDELPPQYRLAVQIILDEPPPQVDLRRLMPPRVTCIASNGSRRRFMTRVCGVSLAGAVAAMLVISVLALRSGDAWAQVAKAVFEQPWVKLELSMPEKNEIVEIWLSPSKRTVGYRVPGSVFFLDFGQHKTQRFAEEDRTIYITDPTATDFEEFVTLESVLYAVSDGQTPKDQKQTAIKLLSQSSKKVVDREKQWTEYVMEYEDSRRAVPRFSRSFSVAVGASLPDKMTETFQHNGKTFSKSYRLAYPKDGPADLFAMGVPKDVKVVDTRASDELKNVLTTYAENQKTRCEPYSATVLLTSTNWTNLSDAYRVQSSGSGYDAEIVDAEQLLRFQMDRSGDTGKVVPEGTEPVAWWKEQVASMRFHGFGDKSLFSPGQTFVADLAGYPLMGIPNEGERATYSSKPYLGPSDTVLIAVEDAKSGAVIRRYWLAPDRGYLCVRSEMPDVATGWIATTIIDAAAKSPQGHWYAIQVRTGRVEHSGDDLRAGSGVAPVATSLYRYLLEFANDEAAANKSN